MNDALSPGITQFLSNKDAANYSSYPKAFLNWVLFDNQFHFVQGGVSQVKSGTSKQALVADIPVMPRSGYLFIYLSNESSQDVFFDQLVVHHRPGPLLAEDHYYPFGLEMVGISDRAMGRLENRYRYNGMELNEKEFADGWGLDVYTARFRGLDVQIGRWWQIDPKQDVEESGYAANEDNPVMWSDPEGDCPWCLAILGEMAAGAAISGAIEAGIQLYDIATTDKKLSDFSWQQVGEAAAVGAVTGPIFSWAGRAVSPYLKRITANITSRSLTAAENAFVRFGVRGSNVVVKTTEEVNKEFLNIGWKAPYKARTKVIEFTTTQEEKFVRVFNSQKGNKVREWIMKESELYDESGKMLTPEQIKDKFALPGKEPPDKMVEVKIPAGIRIRAGYAAKVEGWGEGGG
ncbi:MAG: hypothetical protein IMW88_01240 [Thermoflavifilum sp.]|uniref:RHS repeat domain-containing protein n=1 Tax=Thermoflavifilum sp. TaxID=1968839 RepID=UPI0018A5E4BD|nr:RHS repeat-associated core domain-containing protein [Thermoflavifilum sp.]QOR76229.1 MAG: hypothetical protein IMW88_01240 [Thermoflavifilum sp.]